MGLVSAWVELGVGVETGVRGEEGVGVEDTTPGLPTSDSGSGGLSAVVVGEDGDGEAPPLCGVGSPVPPPLPLPPPGVPESLETDAESTALAGALCVLPGVSLRGRKPCSSGPRDAGCMLTSFCRSDMLCGIPGSPSMPSG